ncbi:MAG: sigma-70 family RNA polymerase sigma factor [Fibrobacter sp.]|nr:sigma-70 family RNA polymerase sigma factor [Fibrobacter sp.]
MAKQRILTETQNSSSASCNEVESIWKENAPQIYKLCSRCSRNLESADDLFQDVALKFCQYVPNLDCTRSLYPWFATVVRHVHYDHFRKHGDRLLPMSHLSDTEEEYDVFPNSAAIFYHDEYAQGRVRHELEYLMSELDPFERTVVNLTHIDGFSVKDMCRVSGKSKSLLSQKRKSAMEKMQKKKQDREELLKKMDAPPFILEDLLTCAS